MSDPFLALSVAFAILVGLAVLVRQPVAAVHEHAALSTETSPPERRQISRGRVALGAVATVAASVLFLIGLSVYLFAVTPECREPSLGTAVAVAGVFLAIGAAVAMLVLMLVGPGNAPREAALLTVAVFAPYLVVASTYVFSYARLDTMC